MWSLKPVITKQQLSIDFYYFSLFTLSSLHWHTLCRQYFYLPPTTTTLFLLPPVDILSFIPGCRSGPAQNVFVNKFMEIWREKKKKERKATIGLHCWCWWGWLASAERFLLNFQVKTSSFRPFQIKFFICKTSSLK